jgi:hypothetical protein
VYSCDITIIFVTSVTPTHPDNSYKANVLHDIMGYCARVLYTILFLSFLFLLCHISKYSEKILVLNYEPHLCNVIGPILERLFLQCAEKMLDFQHTHTRTAPLFSSFCVFVCFLGSTWPTDVARLVSHMQAHTYTHTHTHIHKHTHTHSSSWSVYITYITHTVSEISNGLNSLMA